MKKRLISCLTAISMWFASCSGQTKSCDMETIQNDTTYTVWTTYIYEGKDTNGNYTNWSKLHVNPDLVQSLPISAKIVIAYYSTFIDFGLDKKAELDLAQALGEFTTLEEAQQTLLKNWKGKNNSIKGHIYTLNLRRTKQSFFFEYSVDYNEKKTEQWKIDKNGKLKLK